MGTFARAYRLTCHGLLACIALMGLSACATYEYHEATIAPISKADNDAVFATDESLLLDVGIVVFDAGLDQVDDVSVEYASVRASEAVWFSSMLRDTMEQSRAWGLVRVLPSDQTLLDLTVRGELIESNGETAVLDVTVTDARGTLWLDRRYEMRASQYSYNPEIDLQQDPFQPLLTEVANNLYDVLAQQSAEALALIRQMNRLRFAQRFAPDLVSDYLQERDGDWQIVRAPAQDDPYFQKIDAIYARNHMYLDVVHDYYRAFNADMDTPYHEWRKLSYKEVQYERQLRQQSKQEKWAGVALMAAGVVASSGRGTSTNIGRYLSFVSGGWLFAKSYEKEVQAALHAETLRELGMSLEGELAPSVIDLQDRTVTLSGTVQDQYDEWSQIMQALFNAEFGTAASSGGETLEPSLLNEQAL